METRLELELEERLQQMRQPLALAVPVTVWPVTGTRRPTVPMLLVLVLCPKLKRRPAASASDSDSYA